MEEYVYQIMVGNMYVKDPKVSITKQADPHRKFMGFRIGKAPKEKNEYEFLETSFSDTEQNLHLPNDILEVIVNGLAVKHSDLVVYQMVPHQIFPPIEEQDIEVQEVEVVENIKDE